jgi:lipoate-protein ligase A
MKTFFLSQKTARNQMPFERKLFKEANASGEIILLLYSWAGDVISIGKSQKSIKIDMEKCRKDGVETVERITGGRAVFHSGDICYSVSIPKIFAQKTGEDLKTAILSISRPIKKTFADFGIVADCKTGGNCDSIHSDFCARTRSWGEICVANKKICASSQIYSAGGILQHGTIPLTAGYLRICDYFFCDGEKAKEVLRENSACLSDLREDLSVEDFIFKFAQNFEEWAAGLGG